MDSLPPSSLSRLLDDDRLPGILCVALLISLIATHLTTGTVIDTLAVCAIIAALAVVYTARNTDLPLPVYWVWLFGALCALLLVQILLGRFSTWKFALEPLFDIATVGVAIFVLPQLLPLRAFFRIVATVTAGLFAVDLIGYIAGISAPIVVGPGEATVIGMIGVVGCIGTLAAFDAGRRPLDAGLAIIAGWFVFASAARGVWLAFVIALVLFALLSRDYHQLATLAVGVGALALVAFVATVIAAPRSWVVGLPLTNRQYLWRGTWRAITKTPLSFLTGVGYLQAAPYLKPYIHYNLYKPHGPHNGYLLAWLRGGLLTAVLHAAFTWGPIAIGLRRRASPALVALAVAFAVEMAVENYILISLGLRSVLFAILCGYIIRECAERWETADFNALKRRFATRVHTQTNSRRERL